MTQFADLITDKKFLTGSSALALALGMGATPAYATLVTTQFNSTQQAALDGNNNAYFGPSGHTGDFYANLSSGPGDFFNLTGVGLNGVSDTIGCVSTGPGSCALKTYSPGDMVDGSANFQSSGDFKTAGPEFTPADGNYYFGLDDVGGVADPFGWAEITLTDDVVKLDQFAFEDNTDPAPIPTPEPATLSLFAVGAAAVLAVRRRKKRQAA